MKVAVVGATGMVGTVMLNVLEERNFPVSELLAVASARSVEKSCNLSGRRNYSYWFRDDAVAAQPDIALFSAGGATSLEWAPKFAAVGTRVIDNSSAWRMDAKVPLVVPEVNAEALRASDTIIANPNCSTIQMVTALGPVHQKYGIQRLVISTYQSITGTGVKAVQQLEDEMQGTATAPAYPHQIHKNALRTAMFFKAGYTKEELKLVNETHKILNDSSIGITATAVRIPVVGGHSEAVNVELNTPFELEDLRQLFQESPGVVLEDVPEENSYPMPITAEGKDEVFVGRIRRDHSNANTFNAWIVADNLRKGAATNTVQIAEYLVAQGWV